MSGETLTPVTERPEPTRTGSRVGRVAAVLEVLLTFSLVHLAYRSFKHFTALGRLEVAAGLNFSPGVTMILFTVTVLLLRQRSFAGYGLTLKGWRYNLNLGLLWAVIVVVAGGAAVLSPVHLDPLHPPDLARAVACSLGLLALTVFLALFLLRERAWLRRIPPALTLSLLIALLSLPLLVAWHFGRPLPGVLLTALWLFFGAGFGEEVFFRGYVQSRVNEAFGRPVTLLGVRFGPGLLVSSLLFGMVYALNAVDYFGGPCDFGWLSLAAASFSGLFFGVMRERTGSVLTGAVVHGLEDVLGRLPSLLP